MLQGRSMEGLAEARRKEFLAEAAASQMKPRPRALKVVPPTRATAPSMVITVASASRTTAHARPIGHKVGAWLIHAGVRLGGATIRTS
jgi:hypothetical protein